jgi:hypothetical protein
MKLQIACVVVALLTLVLSTERFTLGQTPMETATALPHLVRFSGTAKDMNGSPLTGVVGVTFALYSEATGGAALWLETQNITADSNGHYTILLGSTKPDGLPAELFTSERAHWVGVQVSGQAEQPRVLLVSAPYALKAGDAETVGGLPASAFVLAKGDKNTVPPEVNAAVTGKGTIDYIPMWDSASDIVDSVIFQKTSEIGIGTITPAAMLDVNGKADIRDTLTLFPKSTDNTLAVSGTGFNISSTGKVTFITGQTFPGTGTITGITTASGSGLSGGGVKGTLSLKVPALGITNAMLANSKITLNANSAGGVTTPGGMTLGSTYTLGLKPCTANQILQYSGTAWDCATAGTGTITGVTAGTDLTGGGTSGNVTLKLDTTKVPQLASANTFTMNQTFNANAQVIGDVRVDYDGLNKGTTSPGIRFGTGSTGEAISSDRAGTVNVNGIDLYTDFAPRLSINNGGTVGIGTQTPGAWLEVDSQSFPTDAINANGYTAPSGSGLNGSFGLVATGGNSDPMGDSGTGGTGIVGTGGGGVGVPSFDGSGGVFTGGNTSFNGDGVDGYAGSGYAGNFTGDVNTTGSYLVNGSAALEIDHPLDPANKYLVHASVESSEMKNIYDGNVTTDGQGHATVQLPEWFEVLNTDFRYQLTVIGQFAQAIVAREIENNRFEISTSAPNVKVSWQVTGVRQDAYAKAHPLVVEPKKEARLRGFYTHPELYGAPREKQIEWARHPRMMKRIQEMQARQLAAITIKTAVKPSAAQPK